MNNKIIIDVDTGVDDALALILANRVIKDRIIGVTTCGGNVRLEDATTNTLKILSLLDWKLPVYSGASKSINGNEFVHAYDYHGTNGLCDVALKQTMDSMSGTAEDFIIEMVEKYSEKLDIVCLATPTNLAKALLKKPVIAKKIKNVYLMGGALNVSGNQTEFAEYNFFQDPKAVEMVCKNIKNIYIIPLDVTNRCFIAEDLAEKIIETNSTNKFVKEAMINWYRFFGYPKKRNFELYDPLAISALFGDFLVFLDKKIGVNTEGIRQGEIFINGKYSVKIATEVDGKAFLDFFLRTIIDEKC
ncbi:MAG: nucleoside hydrolase [Candidatus Paceibacterota bacterium]|jgi:purine nucleosidase